VQFAPGREVASAASPSILNASWYGRGSENIVEALTKRFPDLLGQCEIQEFAGTDYAFRIFVDKPMWSQVLSGLADEN
jgi:hypothetical protein